MTEHIRHQHGLVHDLAEMEKQLLGRRRALRMLTSSGLAALMAGCGGGGGEASASTTTTTGSTDTSTSTTTTTTTTSSCIVDPTETSGPYPGDGTNTSSGSTSNVLTSSGIVRSDIRSSFLTTTTTATGVRLDLTIKLVNVNNACAALSGYAIYLWHCDANGNYSLYTAPSESYLRGVQITDSNGQVTFTTIFPGCYSGRYPHIHFEVYSNLAGATSGRAALLTSQFALPATQCNEVFADTTVYPSSASNFKQVSTSSDNVFGDNTAAQIAQQTPTLTGTPANGYTASALVGISA